MILVLFISFCHVYLTFLDATTKARRPVEESAA